MCLPRVAQCRERWCHHLDPSVNHGNWTQEEDALLCSLEVGGLMVKWVGWVGWGERVGGLMGRGVYRVGAWVGGSCVGVYFFGRARSCFRCAVHGIRIYLYVIITVNLGRRMWKMLLPCVSCLDVFAAVKPPPGLDPPSSPPPSPSRRNASACGQRCRLTALFPLDGSRTSVKELRTLYLV